MKWNGFTVICHSNRKKNNNRINIVIFDSGINNVDLHFSDSITNNAYFHYLSSTSTNIFCANKIVLTHLMSFQNSVHNTQCTTISIGSILFIVFRIFRNRTLCVCLLCACVCSCVCLVYIPVNWFHVIGSTKDRNETLSKRGAFQFNNKNHSVNMKLSKQKTDFSFHSSVMHTLIGWQLAFGGKTRAPYIRNINIMNKWINERPLEIRKWPFILTTMSCSFGNNCIFNVFHEKVLHLNFVTHCHIEMKRWNIP